jgi:HAMP domain-containing protein
VSFYEQRFLAVILLGITLWVIRQLSRLKPEIKILFMTAFDANDNDL